MSLRLDGLSFGYAAGSPVLSEIDLALRKGERAGVFGRNGSGKSTFARCVAGWLAGRGRVSWDGRAWSGYPPGERAHLVQLVDQNPRLQLSGRAFTVRDEIAFGPENLRLGRAEIAARVDEALAALELGSLAQRDPTTLSGGELQRVVLAGALAMRPQLLVLDEPSTDLDAAGRGLLAAYLAALPAAMTLIAVDTGPHRWLTPLLSRTFVLDSGRIVELADADDPQACRAAGLALPDAADAFLEGRAAGLFELDARPPATLEAAVELFGGRPE